MLVLTAFLSVALVSGVWPLFSRIYGEHGIGRSMIYLPAFMLIGAGIGAIFWAILHREALSSNPLPLANVATVANRPNAAATPVEYYPRPLTLRNLFDTDFKLMSVSNDIDVARSDGRIEKSAYTNARVL